MASLPYPLNGQNFMAEWVWQGCHTLLQIAAHIYLPIIGMACSSSVKPFLELRSLLLAYHDIVVIASLQFYCKL